MTLGNSDNSYLRYDELDPKHRRNNIPLSSFSSTSDFNEQHKSRSVIKIGSVKVRFAQKFDGDDYRAMVPSLPEDSAKDWDDEGEHMCCGVSWPTSSRIPLAIDANNRSKISFGRTRIGDDEEDRYISRSLVRRCSSTSSQAVASVRPGLVDCFGKRENKCCTASQESTQKKSYISSCSSTFNSFKCLSSSSECLVESHKINASKCCSNCGTENCNDSGGHSGLVSRGLQSTESIQSTLDRFQKFRFGGDRTRNNAAAGRRGSGGSHKKKTQRNSDNLKKYTDKLKQNSSSEIPEPIFSNIQSTSSVESTNSKPNQILIPLKTDENIEYNDIFDGVDLKLAKPESRTIVGSYYQRSIPFRSASFSQVFYSPADRKYVRKQACNKRNLAENSATLPRTSTSTQTVAEEPENWSENIACSFSNESTRKLTENRAASDGEYPKDSSKPISILDLEVKEPLKSSVVPIVTPDFLGTFPQPPKRNKHKKHRHRPCGRLYFSDENIFTSNDPEVNKISNKDQKSVECEMISVTITTPQTSDNELEREEPGQTHFEVSFVNGQSQEAVEQEHESAKPNVELAISENIIIPEPPLFPPIQETKTATCEVTESQNLKIDIAQSDIELHNNLLNQTSPSSPEDSLKPNWLPPYNRERRLTPQTSIERDDEPVESFQFRKHNIFSRADSYSEPESDQGEKRSVSPGFRGRLSPSPYSNHDLSDSDSRRSVHSPLPYSKRPLRGPYLEMIVNEQKKPDSAKNTFRNLQLFESRFPPNQNLIQDRAVDDYYLRRSNTSPHSNKLTVAIPKRKISANIPFSSPASLRTTPDDQSSIHHQRTTSSPSQLEYYPDQLASNQNNTVPNQQILHQLLRGSSERSLIQDVDMLNNVFSKPIYKDTRSHIVVELYDTERSYVESLQIVVTKYLQSLKSSECSHLIEPYVVEEIFYKIPEILAYHEIFLEELRIRLEGWNKSKCIGDIFLETFTKPTVIDAYIAFVNNWKTAKDSIKQTCHIKPAFARFLEAMAREHKGKLALDSLLIMPVQRIPRYELLIQSLLKHTEVCHPDYDKLREALRQVHELALRINCTERDSLELEQIENLIDGLGNLVTGDRTFLRYDMVSMSSGQSVNRKERALFLFNDLLIITSIKRRSSTARKPNLLCPSSITSSLEANKYKLLMKIPLEHLDILKVKDENLRKMMKEMEHMTEDANTLSQIIDLVATLHCPHGPLEDTVREMLTVLNKQLNERHVSESQLSYLELTINTRNSVENISVVFPKPEKRTSWEETFLEAKARLNVSEDRRLNPEFLTSVPIRKTRAGLQFTCAAASCNQQDVWVCNSDGYVGQVCILSLNPEPAVTSCNGVCNARILSVSAVPIYKSPDIADKLSNPTSAASLIKTEPYIEHNEIIPIEVLERDIPDIHLDSSSTSDDDDDDESTDDQKDSENAASNTIESTMWLGTEDGVVHIYNCADSLRIKRNRMKIQHNSAVYCILYVEKNVFVSLANGDIYVYNWCASTGWSTSEPTVIPVGCVTTPVSRMFLVCGKLWCICHNTVKILNIDSLQVDSSFSVMGENNRAITSVAVSGFSVYVALQNSAVLRLIHGISCKILAEINIAPAVTKMLSGIDDIIRQHKAACLRVTSLLACKEILWIGTSAGVILTMALPMVKQDTAKVNVTPHPIGLPHGHTGHVRFLTAVKCVNKMKSESGRRSSKIPEKILDTNSNKMLIISGGDGYEDFRSSSVAEIAGREDSTNHLLVWRS